MAKIQINIETVTFNAGHSLILAHKPEKLQMSQINEKLIDEPQEVEQFGLFDRATPNYTTYYPDVTVEDLQPTDAEFIEPVFRMLSNVTVHAQHNPIYFPVDVLKKGMYKMIGQTINIDHEMAVGNAIGAIKSVEWQNAYTAGGVKIPAGFNAIMRIDGKANPRIARGIMMDPPSIHSNSVTVNFAWEKSHSKMDDQEFFSKLGTFDEKGKLVQKIATEIKAFHETSLVSHGADPFARKIDGTGKITNPSYASSRYPLADGSVDYADKCSWDWKNLEVPYNEEVIINTYTGTTIPETINNNNDQNTETMDELLRFLETQFGLDADSLTEENYAEKLAEYHTAQAQALADASVEPEPIIIGEFTGVEDITSEMTRLQAVEAAIPQDLEAQIALAVTGQTAIDSLRTDTDRLYRLTVEEGKEDATLLAMIAGADYKTLLSLHKQYDKLTEGEYNFTCNECGSHSVTRASANPAEEGKDEVNKSNAEVMDEFTGVHDVKLPGSLKQDVSK